MLRALLAPLGWLPLSWLHAAGALAGLAAWRVSARFAARIRDNVRQAGVAPAEFERFCREVAAGIGRGLFELPFVWFRPRAALLSRIRPDPTWHEVIDAGARREAPLILLTPHLGCFEALGRFLAEQVEITIMYRRPRLAWIEPLLRAGRGRGRARLAPADLGGVRALLRTLRAHGTVGLLPDQVPGRGEGVWASFFGRPAYTISLVGRLQASTGARVVLGFAERLPRGAGYALHGADIPTPLPREPEAAAAAVNAAIEAMVRVAPAQYLWSYNRYKVPAGVAPPGVRADGGAPAA